MPEYQEPGWEIYAVMAFVATMFILIALWP